MIPNTVQKRFAQVFFTRVNFFSSVPIPNPVQTPNPTPFPLPHTQASTPQSNPIRPKRVRASVPRNQGVLQDVLLIPLDSAVEFPHGPISLRVADTALYTELYNPEAPPPSIVSKAKSKASAPKVVVGLVSQFSSTAGVDRDVVKSHIKSYSKSVIGKEFDVKQFFERVHVPTQEFDPWALHEVGMTDWRCADVGTLVQLDNITPVVPEYSPLSVPTLTRTDRPTLKMPSITNNNKSNETHLTSDTATDSALLLTGNRTQRFFVRKHKRTLTGAWTADIELMHEGLGSGGLKHALSLMRSLQHRTYAIAHMCDANVCEDILNAHDPIAFSYALPKIFPFFGVSSLLSQAVLQCSSCTARLTLERHIIEHIAKTFNVPLSVHHSLPLASSLSLSSSVSTLSSSAPTASLSPALQQTRHQHARQSEEGGSNNEN